MAADPLTAAVTAAASAAVTANTVAPAAEPAPTQPRWRYAAWPGGWALRWLLPVLLGLAAAAALRLAVPAQDETVFRALNAAGATAPRAWAMLSVAGLGLGVWLILGAVWSWACACGAVAQRDRAAAALGALLLAFPVGGAVTHGLKALFDTPRPPAVLADIVVIGQPLMHHSLPSGHSITAFTVAGIVLACWPLGRAGRWAVLAAAAAVALSRITTGAHWPSDVAAGAAIGWALALPMVAAQRATGLAGWLQRPRGQWIGLLLLLASAASMTQQRTGYPSAEPLQWLLAAGVVVAGAAQARALWRHRHG